MGARRSVFLSDLHVISKSLGQSWPLGNYCPLPDVIDGVPANNDYKPYFTAAMMQKDLRLAQDAAQSVDACTPLGAHALAKFSLFCSNGDAQTDYSGISKPIGGDAWDYPCDLDGE